MRRPTLRGCAGAFVALVVVATVMVLPETLGDLPALPLSVPRIETFISSACGGSTPCPSTAGPSAPDRARWLGVLQKHLADRMPSIPAAERARLANVIYEEAQAASLDPLFVLAVIAVESGFRHGAESGAGARGLMQLTPETLATEKERSNLQGDLDDPVLNVRAGVRYYQRLMQAFGSTDLALMAYNAGPNRILKYLKDGEIPERFLSYPRRIQQELGRFQRRHRAAPVAVARAQPWPAAPQPEATTPPQALGSPPAAPPATAAR